MRMAERQSWFCICVLIICLVGDADGDGDSISGCRSVCGGVEVDYPLAIDDGCGAPQFRNMLSCEEEEHDLEFHTISGTFKVQNIDYHKQKLTLFDPNMSTCNTLQLSSSKEFKMEKVQSLVIPPSPDTLFILLNCSTDSPLLHRYSSLCTNFSANTCDQLYSCPAFKLLVLGNSTPPPCCATDYNTLNLFTMELLGCSHYTAIYNADSLNGMNPLDWPYGIRLSYSIPDTICPQCQQTGGTCGFNTETERTLCLCNGGMNSTRDCGIWSTANSLKRVNVELLSMLSFIIAGMW